MKKLIALLCICGIVAMSCTKKVVPATGSTETKSSNDGAKTTDEKNNSATTPVTSQSSFGKPTEPIKPPDNSMPATPGAMDQGKTLFITKCTSCHAAKTPGDYTASRWDDILRSMIPKAKVNSSEAAQITAYIKANAK